MLTKAIRLLLFSGTNLPLGATIQLSASSIAEDASVADVIGILSVANGSGTYTFTITADPDSKFQIDNDDELQVADTLDYETDTSHSVTIEADNGVDDPITRQFTITITDVLAPGQITITPVEEPTEDTTPGLTIGFPHGNGNATDAAEGDELIILASDDDFATDETYIEHTLTSDDIDDIEAETPITLSGATPLAVGTWKFRGHLERGAEIGADSLDATQTIEAPDEITITAVDNPAFQVSGTPATFAAANLGAASAGRVIVVFLTSNSIGRTDTVSVTLDGNAMTKAIDQIDQVFNSSYQGIWYIVDESNTSADIVASTDGATWNSVGIMVYAITGNPTSAPNSTAARTYNYGADPQTTTAALTVSAGGGAIAGGGSETAATNATWNVGTGDYRTAGASWMAETAHITDTGSVTPSASDIGGGGWGMVAASWEP